MQTTFIFAILIASLLAANLFSNVSAERTLNARRHNKRQKVSYRVGGSGMYMCVLLCFAFWNMLYMLGLRRSVLKVCPKPIELDSSFALL